MRQGVRSLMVQKAPTAPWTLHLLLIILSLTEVTPAWGIRCYECVYNNQRVKLHNRFVFPCSEFDGSDRYIMDCPDSQLCIYQVISLTLFSERVQVSTMDGCTPNTTSKTRYTEAGLVRPGCVERASNYKTSSSLYCYCAHDLCNAAPSPHSRPSLPLLLALSLVVAEMYKVYHTLS